ncbi:NUMOD4 domain-containing protein [Xenorhabdus sp. KJ12.1]|uniref:NUMOD4 domain-containing protein n=1 Tax=Xenorhabdus sp. KJ12.1 TaxID=1851571 RepID=UPI000C04053C|nr:NUMOD4 domain-containing protein [Xenorhabdus sp. KJ12.1]PHM73050.1 HNH endonuclease:NUMOD4 [Xenorhabdus sp. KJ12.1]
MNKQISVNHYGINFLLEEWQSVPITGYFDFYRVSNLGRIHSLHSNRVLKGKIHYSGYHSVKLSLNGVITDFSVHRLVAMAFVPNPMNLPGVRHLDGDILNNQASNLTWSSASNGILNSAILAISTATGSHLVFVGKNDLLAAGFDSSTVYACLNGRAKTHKGYRFERIALEGKSC